MIKSSYGTLSRVDQYPVIKGRGSLNRTLGM